MCSLASFFLFPLLLHPFLHSSHTHIHRPNPATTLIGTFLIVNCRILMILLLYILCNQWILFALSIRGQFQRGIVKISFVGVRFYGCRFNGREEPPHRPDSTSPTTILLDDDDRRKSMLHACMHDDCFNMRVGDRRRDIIFAHYDGVRWSDLNVNRVAGFFDAMMDVHIMVCKSYCINFRFL